MNRHGTRREGRVTNSTNPTERILRQYPARSFIIVTLAITFATLIIFNFLYRATHLGSISTISDAIAAVTGVAVGLAGSAVAIILAVQALKQGEVTQGLEQTTSSIEAKREAQDRSNEIFSFYDSLKEASGTLYVEAQKLCTALAIEENELDLKCQEIQKAKENAASALDEFANAIARLGRIGVLEQAWKHRQNQILRSPFESEANKRTLDNRIVLSDYLRFQIKAFETNQTRYRDSLSDLGNEPPKTVYGLRDLHETANYYDDEVYNNPSENFQDDWCKPVWRSPIATHAKKTVAETGWSISGLDPVQLSVWLMKVAADLRSTNNKRIWYRFAYTRFCKKVQNLAVIDPNLGGGYRLTEYPHENSLVEEKNPNGLKVKKKVGRTKEQLLREAAPFNVLSKCTTIDSQVALDPTLRFLVFMDPIAPLRPYPTRLVEDGTLETKGGSTVQELPHDLLSLNRFAFNLAEIMFLLPDAQYIFEAMKTEKISAVSDHLFRLVNPALIAKSIDEVMPDFGKAISEETYKVLLPTWPTDEDDAAFVSENPTWTGSWTTFAKTMERAVAASRRLENNGTTVEPVKRKSTHSFVPSQRHGSSRQASPSRRRPKLSLQKSP